MKKKFHLDRRNGKVMGVCAGIADYFGIDATFVRIGAVVVTLLGAFPWTLIAYGVAAWLAKPKPYGAYEAEDVRAVRGSTHALRRDMTDIDRRMAEVETYVTSANGSLAREIEQLR
ncbi:MAG TPA: PspC domain-containing protein [Allosphingosinicella sp.]|nr:PspC domain-containing protein [Allosphingosinicella sp.]